MAPILSADEQSFDSVNLPGELWVLIATASLEHYLAFSRVSHLHNRALNRAAMINVRHDITEYPDFEPGENDKSYYYRVADELKVKMLPSGVFAIDELVSFDKYGLLASAIAYDYEKLAHILIEKIREMNPNELSDNKFGLNDGWFDRSCESL